MNPIMKHIALWLSETFVASSLEIILEAIIEVYNYSILTYDLPLPFLNYAEMGDNRRNCSNSSNVKIDELLKITDDLIDFSQDEVIAQNLNQIGEPNGNNTSELTEILSSLKEFAPSFQVQNANDSKHVSTRQDSAELLGADYRINGNGKSFEEKAFNEDLNLDNGDGSDSSSHYESSNLLNKYQEPLTIAKDCNITMKVVEQERNIVGLYNNQTSEIRNTTPLCVEQSIIDSSTSQKVSFEGNKELFPTLYQEITSKEIEATTFDDHGTSSTAESKSCFEYIDDSTKNKESRIELVDSGVSNIKSLKEKQRKVKFSDEIDLFVFEPQRSVHHPCVISKSPISFLENKDKCTTYRTALLIEEIEETNYYSSCTKENQKERKNMFQENTDILETVRKVHDESRSEVNSHSSDESDASDISIERQNRIEGWLQLTENEYLLDNVHPIRRSSSHNRHRDKDSKLGLGNIRFRKASVTTAKKQPKDILDKICKKLLKQKPSTRK